MDHDPTGWVQRSMGENVLPALYEGYRLEANYCIGMATFRLSQSTMVNVWRLVLLLLASVWDDTVSANSIFLLLFFLLLWSDNHPDSSQFISQYCSTHQRRAQKSSNYS